jgi:hypothetical protein
MILFYQIIVGHEARIMYLENRKNVTKLRTCSKYKENYF